MTARTCGDGERDLIEVARRDPDAVLNVLMTDGSQILGLTWGDTLSYLVEPDGVAVASEPWDDDPRWIEVERELKRTSDLESDAAIVLLTVQPTTLAGILALLNYAVEADTDGVGWPAALESDDGQITRSWQVFLIEGIAEALAGLVAGGMV